MKFLFICLFLFFTPVYSHAAVVINEVAWMGTEVSANDEWIELYNNGSNTVSVSGWVLSDDGGLEIELTGSIAAGQFAVLERTDDASAPGTAFLIYTGALSNTGATLFLYRSDDSLEDRVPGGEDWQNIGGDNTTKETAQYTISGWVTAAATPGSVNNGDIIPDEDDEEEEESDNEENDSSSSKGHSSTVSTLYTTPRELLLELEIPNRMYVNQEVLMSVNASGLSSPILNSLTHNWNFGDVTVGTGEEVTHRYEYPGEYVVTLHSQYKEYEAYARQTVVVLPVSFSLTTNSVGDIQVHNDSRYEVDVSGYKIQSQKTLRFPERTILLPKATITIPKEKLGYAQGKIVELKDEMQTRVASLGIALPVPLAASNLTILSTYTPPSSKKVLPEIPEETPSSNFSFAGGRPSEVTVTDQDIVLIEEATAVPIENSLVAAPIQAADTIPSEKLPYFALLAVIGLGVVSVFASKVRS